MEETKELLNEVLVDLFNQIMFNEEKNLITKIGTEVTIRDIHIIEAIYKNAKLGNSTSNIVAKSLNITAGTLTTAVKRLATKGYVLRETDSKDKRVVRLFLTKKGEKVNEAHKQFHVDMINKVVEDLSFGEEKHLIQLLTKVKTFFTS